MALVICIGVCAAVAAALLFLLLPGKSTPALRAPFEGVNYAHRGLHTKDKSVPENSLAAFGAAVAGGYGMELDLQLSRDGQVVVFHDDDLPRVCGVEGRVDSYTYAQLREFRLANTEAHIPLFSEVLALVAGAQPLIVELKTHPARNDELCEKAHALLKDYKGPYCIESFDPRIVRWFKINAPEVLRGQLASEPKSLGNGINGVLIGTLLCNFLGRPHFIAYDTGKKPLTAKFAQLFAMKVTWTVRPQNDIAGIEKTADGIIFEYYTPQGRYKKG